MGQANLRVVENTSMDKNKALDAALSQIERAFGKGSIMKLGSNPVVEIEAISTGSLGLDIALGIGGLPPRFCDSAMVCSARVVLPEDSGP